MANVYVCELCQKPVRDDYDVVRTPFYFEVLPGYDNDAWGKHSNEAKVCNRHIESYDSEFWTGSRTPRERMVDDVIARCAERRVPEGVEVDYYFARDRATDSDVSIYGAGC